jgi:hypothetical protein
MKIPHIPSTSYYNEKMDYLKAEDKFIVRNSIVFNFYRFATIKHPKFLFFFSDSIITEIHEHDLTMEYKMIMNYMDSENK